MAESGYCKNCGAALNGGNFCPSCGTPVTPAVSGQTPAPAQNSAPSDKRPETIEELRAYAASHNWPVEQMRLFIGIDMKEAKAFGIYKEGELFTVYKNKANGQRAVRYCGPDEKYAVGELYDRMSKEVQAQKALQQPSVATKHIGRDPEPDTIPKLYAYAKSHNWPVKDMHLFIGKNTQEPQAYGIYAENGVYTVYKNKADGTRSVRYQGPDEKYAVSEIFKKMAPQAKAATAPPSYTPPPRRPGNPYNGGPKKPKKKTSPLKIVLIIIAAVIVIGALYDIIFLTPTRGYYYYDDTYYYYLDDGWYYYDDYYNDWYYTDDVDEDLYDNYSDYYYGYNYGYDYTDGYYSDFGTTDYYEEWEEDNSSSSSSSDDSWSSSDSWDSGSTDWDSDW